MCVNIINTRDDTLQPSDFISLLKNVFCNFWEWSGVTFLINGGCLSARFVVKVWCLGCQDQGVETNMIS